MLISGEPFSGGDPLARSTVHGFGLFVLIFTSLHKVRRVLHNIYKVSLYKFLTLLLRFKISIPLHGCTIYIFMDHSISLYLR